MSLPICSQLVFRLRCFCSKLPVSASSLIIALMKLFNVMQFTESDSPTWLLMSILNKLILNWLHISQFSKYNKLINLLMDKLTTSYSAQLPFCEWDGLKPQKFRGGRKHDNHPRDELDNLLMGTAETQIKYLGPSKRRAEPKANLKEHATERPHLRANPNKNESKVVFSAEQIPKLIKIPPRDQFKESNSLLFRVSQLGESKLKNLQGGLLKTGIYRNFYKSQQSPSKIH